MSDDGETSSAKLGCSKSKAESPVHSTNVPANARQSTMTSGGVSHVSTSAGMTPKAGGQLFPSPNPSLRASSTVAATSPVARAKVALAPGHSLMDWIRLGRSGEDLTGVGTHSKPVTPEELAKHNREDDAWLALRGKVYNVTRYMDFHPGGTSELMRGVGKDATELFDDIHKWVNAESMLEKCLIGPYVTTGSRRCSTSSGSNIFLNPNGISLTNLKPPSGPQPPSMDWFQNSKTVTIVVYTKWQDVRPENVIIDCEQNKLLLTVILKEHAFHIHKDLEGAVTDEYKVKALDSGKVEVVLQKTVPDKHWADLGKNLDRHCTFIKLKDRTPTYRKCQVSSISEVTHDTRLFRLSFPPGTRMCVPVGYHIRVRHSISGVEVVRSYTVVLPSLNPEEQDQDQASGKALYLMVKIYPTGTISSWLGSLGEGDSVEVSDYDGDFVGSSLQTCSHLVMLAAGSGFTPMVRLMYQTLVEEAPAIRKVKLLFFNKTQKDIMWNDQLQQLASSNSKFEFVPILSEPDEEWSGLTGRIRAELLTNQVPKEEDGVRLLACACGPTPFTKEAMRLLEEQGVKEESRHAFLG